MITAAGIDIKKLLSTFQYKTSSFDGIEIKLLRTVSNIAYKRTFKIVFFIFSGLKLTCLKCCSRLILENILTSVQHSRQFINIDNDHG